MSTCFPYLPLRLSYIPCPTTTLKIILLVSFWLHNIYFQKCIFWADCNSLQLLFSTSRSASFAHLYIFFHHVHPCVSSVSHALSFTLHLTLSFTPDAYTASGKSCCSKFLCNSCLKLLLQWKVFIIFIPMLSQRSHSTSSPIKLREKIDQWREWSVKGIMH